MEERTTLAGSTILIIDDNRDGVDALAILLRSSGYAVVATYTVREALDALDEHSNVRVVVSDIRMPDLDGFDFLRVVRQRFPAMKVILMTGYPVTEMDVVPHGATILQKPFESDALVRLLPPAV